MMPGDVAAPKVPASAFAGKSETASTGHAKQAGYNPILVPYNPPVIMVQCAPKPI